MTDVDDWFEDEAPKVSRAGGTLTDEGGRPVMDEGGRPVIAEVHDE
jgi:hypothetical protein